MLKITKSAADQVRRAAEQGGMTGLALRLAALRRADGSFDYKMGFDEVDDDDIRFNSEGVEVIMEPEQVPLLDETVMDFVRLDSGEEQFIFINPKDANYTPPTQV